MTGFRSRESVSRRPVMENGPWPESLPKITLSSVARHSARPACVLSQSNVRRVKAGVSIDSAGRRTSPAAVCSRASTCGPCSMATGQETGQFEIPAGGRRYRALELLAKQKRLAKDAPIPCVVRGAANDILAEEDSLAGNSFREALHPLDEFRAMQAMVEKDAGIEEIAAHFHTTPAAVRQRLKLASVSPRLHALYAEEAMTLDQLHGLHRRRTTMRGRKRSGSSSSTASTSRRPGSARSSPRTACARRDKRARFVGPRRLSRSGRQHRARPVRSRWRRLAHRSGASRPAWSTTS